MRKWMGLAPWVAFIGVLLTLISSHYSVQLYQNLRTEFEELLPGEARSVQDIHQAKDRLESSQNLVILSFSDNSAQNKRFVTDLAQAIERELAGRVSRVEYRIDQEIRFFSQRRALMMELRDLKKIRDYIKSRIEYERQIRNPLNIVSGIKLDPPALNMESLTNKYAKKIEDYSKFLKYDGYYAMNEGKIRAILVYASGSSLGVQSALELRSRIDDIILRLQPSRFSPDLRIRFTGDMENLIEERNSLIADLKLSSAIVILLVLSSLFIYFRSGIATLALIVSLLAGTFWTFGAAYFVTGFLNANSAFLGSIVLGNGINFGIVFLARYLEERRRLPHWDALPIAMKGAVPGTLTAALAAGLAYGSLGLTAFRGFRQFGIIGLMGMILCWIASFTLLPAILTLLDRFSFHVIPKKAQQQEGQGSRIEKKIGFARLAAWAVTHYPRGILVAGLVTTFVLGALALRHPGPFLETDTSRLRDWRSLAYGSGYYSRFIDQMFGRFLSPLIILPHTRTHTRQIADRLRALQQSEGSTTLISSVYTIDDLVPPQQLQKIQILKEIDHLLTPSIRASLSHRDQRLIRELLPPQSLRPFRIQDLPRQTRARFQERDNSTGKLILVEPIFSSQIMNDFSNQKKLIDQIRQTADSVEPQTPVVGQLPITVDMIASVSRDGPRATLFAFLSVVLLTFLLFRNSYILFEVLFTLLLGIAWMFCAALALQIKINFLNFVAIPITFGIGVDYGINILTRLRSEGVSRLYQIVSMTGGALSLASLTTMIGYGSLLLAGNQGFISFGRLAILGEITCLFAAVFMLPAFMKWKSTRKRNPPESSALHPTRQATRQATDREGAA